MAFRNDPRLAVVMGSISRGHCCVCTSLLTFTASDPIVSCNTCRSSMNHVRTSKSPNFNAMCICSRFICCLYFRSSSRLQSNSSLCWFFIIYTLTLACLSQRTCPNCTTSLIFPVHVQNVQCGRCGFNTVFLPQQRRNESQIPHHRLLTCTSCRTTISFPSDAPAVKSVHALATLILASQFFFFIIITTPLKVRCLRLCHTVEKASRGLYLFYLLSLPMLKICSRLFSLWTQTCRLTMLSLWPSSWIPCSLLGANLPWFHRGSRETTSVAGADSA